MSNKRMDLIVGTRPNLIKCAVLYRKLKEKGFSIKLIHTGQHYDKNMSELFFEDLNIPKEDVNLNVGSYSHAKQTAYIMERYEEEIEKDKPDMTIVFGDVNSTIACVLTAKKLHIKTAHVEAGLRSFDMKMPEEINRLATDSISDILFASSENAVINLIKEGHKKGEIYHVGNIMIDTLLENMDKIDAIDINREFNIENREYVFLTLHRPSNVDFKKRLYEIIMFLNKIAEHKKVIFPIHPRTKKNIIEFNYDKLLNKNIIMIDPISYLKSIKLIKESCAVITDSGGIQEESSFLGVKCFTLRKNTERPITLTQGTNKLIEPIIEDKIINDIINAKNEKTNIPLWDGKVSQRIVEILEIES